MPTDNGNGLGGHYARKKMLVTGQILCEPTCKEASKTLNSYIKRIELWWAGVEKRKNGVANHRI